MPLFWLSLSFLIGLLLASLLSWSWLGWLALAAACLIAWVILWRLIPPAPWLRPLRRLAQPGPPVVLPPLLLLAALFGGAARYQAAIPVITPRSIAWYNDAGALSITGMVAAMPDQRDATTYLRVAVSQIAPSDASSPVSAPQASTGLILVQTTPFSDYQYGDVLRIVGNPATPDSGGDFSYQDALARQGILSTLSFGRITRLKTGQGSPFLAVLYTFKQHALAVMEQIFPPPESDLMEGILLGVSSGMPPDLQQAFKNTGTAHIIAISG